MPANDRPQDVGRSHARKRPSASSTANAALIERWQAVERATLERVTVALEGRDNGKGLDGSAMPREYPSNSETAALIDLGVKIARDLGSAIDPHPLEAIAGPPAPTRARRRHKLDL